MKRLLLVGACALLAGGSYLGVSLHEAKATGCEAKARASSPSLTPAQVSALCSPSSPASTAPDARSMAAAVGATGISPITPTLYAASEAIAQWHGGPVDVVTFSSQSLRDKWVAIASEYEPIMTTGPDWVIASSD